jgi:hypothetical protein
MVWAAALVAVALVAQADLPGYLAIEPDGSVYDTFEFTARLSDPSGRVTWFHEWVFPTLVRCEEARLVVLDLARQVPGIDVTDCH